MAEHSEPRSWRQTAGPRLLIVGVLLSVWAVAVFARLVDLQIFQHEALEARGEAPADEHSGQCRPSAATSSIATASPSPTRWRKTPSASIPRKLENPRQAVARLCGALGDCTADERVELETTPQPVVARVRERARLGERRAGAPRGRAREDARAASEEARRPWSDARRPPREEAASVLPEQGTGGQRARVRRRRQQGACRPRAAVRRHAQRAARPRSWCRRTASRSGSAESALRPCPARRSS